mmetsp:Transcript_38591/g.66694  ORF Transcript_38591/g.66694 Transcript_38591/m.66694 type:complete len:204 (-) Transcript_38591:1679-2290(-)
MGEERGTKQELIPSGREIVQAQRAQHIPRTHLSVVFITREHVRAGGVQVVQHLADAGLGIGSTLAGVSLEHTHVQLVVDGLVVVGVLPPAVVRHLGHLVNLAGVAANVEGRGALGVNCLELCAHVLARRCEQLVQTGGVVRQVEAELPGPSLSIVPAPRELVERLGELAVHHTARAEEGVFLVEQERVVGRAGQQRGGILSLA